MILDRKSTRLNSSHGYISYAVFCLKKKQTNHIFFIMLRIQPRTTLFPYTTLFRSIQRRKLRKSRTRISAHGRPMENRFGVKDFITMILLVVLILSVWFAMKQYDRQWNDIRSEEHTSELQSRLHLVCRLLLEKKTDKPYFFYNAPDTT